MQKWLGYTPSSSKSAQIRPERASSSKVKSAVSPSSLSHDLPHDFPTFDSSDCAFSEVMVDMALPPPRAMTTAPVHETPRMAQRAKILPRPRDDSGVCGTDFSVGTPDSAAS